MVLCYPGNVDKENFDEGKLPSLICFDSLGSMHPKTVKNIRDYLTKEWEVKKKDRETQTFDKDG